MPVRRGRPGKPGPAARLRCRCLARVRPRGGSRAGLRVPRAWPVGPRPRTALQPGQAAARPVRPGVPGRGQLRARGIRLRRGPAGHAELAGFGRARAVRPGGGRHIRLGRRRQAADRLRGHDHLRGARQGPDHAASGRAGRAAGQLRRARARGGYRLPDPAGRDRRGAAAGASVRTGGVPAEAGADQLLGLQLDRLLRAAPALFRGGAGRAARRAGGRVPGDGPGTARRGPGGHPGRGVQPHRRRPARAVPRCASAAWTTRRTTGWTRPTRAGTTTPRAPGTRSTPGAR